MPFQIRHKESGEVLVLRSGKSVWAKAGHAKAAFKTSGLDRYGYGSRTYAHWGLKPGGRFDDQDVFEIVETVPVAEATKLLADCLIYLDKSSLLHAQVQKFLEDNK